MEMKYEMRGLRVRNPNMKEALSTLQGLADSTDCKLVSVEIDGGILTSRLSFTVVGEGNGIENFMAQAIKVLPNG